VLNALLGCRRSLYLAVHDGLLPWFSQYTNRHGAPDYAMAFSLAYSVMVVFVASRLENYVSSNMGYLLIIFLDLFGHFVYLRQYQGVPRPVRMPGLLRYVALGIEGATLFVWSYGGYHVPNVAVRPGRRWLFFLGWGSSCFTRRSTPTGASWRSRGRMTLARGKEISWNGPLTGMDVGHCRCQRQA
jgi:amino acid transporter